MDESINVIEKLFDQYKDDEYMISRIHQYICNRLPKIFETIHKTHITNQTYEEQMQTSQEAFIQGFLNLNKYQIFPFV